MGRGVLFSLMALLLLSALFNIYETALRGQVMSDEGLQEAAAMAKVADKFANVKSNTIMLTANSAERAVDVRILPFDYNLGNNTVSFSTEIPARQEVIDDFLGGLNSLRIFLEDTNYSNEFDSIHTDINTLTPVDWGGTDRNVSFIALPQCMKFSILDQNTITLKFVCADYNYLSITRQDINISFTPANSFDAISCSFNSSPSCPDNDFNAQSPLPYMEIALGSSACPSCSLPQRARGHFDPAYESYVRIRCSDGNCSPVDVNLNEGIAINYGGPRIRLGLGLQLDSDIMELLFSDLNLAVSDIYFGIRRWRD